MSTLKRSGLIILIVTVLAMALIGVLTITRGTPVGYVVTLSDSGPPAVGDSLFERTMELFTGTHVYDGNAVQQANNGDGVYPPLWADLRSARNTITVQMYYSLPGRVADTLAAILRERARAKVRVLLLLDAFGSQHLSREWIRSLRDAGVEVAKLRQLRWFTISNAANRSHVRVVVVDGRIAYTGGFGLADYWLGDGHHEEQWRESNVRFQGPAVMELQSAFAAAWAEATGELLTGPLFFPESGFQPVGPTRAGLMFAAPTTGSTPAERFLALTITGARKTLYIENSYFVPDDDFRRLLERAARRGVDVRVLTVSNKTDVKTTWYAGRYRYEELLRHGIHMYEYQPTMLHSKTIVADGLWSSVGSMNFDNRSLAFNDEANLVVLDSAFGAQMDSIFFDDLRYAREIKLDEFQRRSIWSKSLELGATLLSRLL
ncbi:MAG TPA: phospholipase D-like domain-containing protein [Gemmatimonadaceae bacterium]|jgi:cardiolipin synthase|nr:phospholipase D-like domain-containing protein [Gemmatimonadaceae bacterium]